MKVLVTTSNDYVHCLPAFAELYNRFFAGEVTVLRYDVRPPALPGNFKQFAVGPQAEYSWSAGLKVYLKWLRENQPEDPYILMLCEDYFITDVEMGAIVSAERFMQETEFVGKVDVSGDLVKRIEKSDSGNKENYPIVGFVEATHETPWLASIQAAIWHRDFLDNYLVESETAWQFEKKGTKRIAKDMLGDPKGNRILGVTKPALAYVNAVGGEGKKPGIYDRKKIPQAMWDELSGLGLVK